MIKLNQSTGNRVPTKFGKAYPQISVPTYSGQDPTFQNVVFGAFCQSAARVEYCHVLLLCNSHPSSVGSTLAFLGDYSLHFW